MLLPENYTAPRVQLADFMEDCVPSDVLGEREILARILARARQRWPAVDLEVDIERSHPGPHLSDVDPTDVVVKVTRWLTIVAHVQDPEREVAVATLPKLVAPHRLGGTWYDNFLFVIVPGSILLDRKDFAGSPSVRIVSDPLKATVDRGRARLDAGDSLQAVLDAAARQHEPHFNAEFLLFRFGIDIVPSRLLAHYWSLGVDLSHVLGADVEVLRVAARHLTYPLDMFLTNAIVTRRSWLRITSAGRQLTTQRNISQSDPEPPTVAFQSDRDRIRGQATDPRHQRFIELVRDEPDVTLIHFTNVAEPGRFWWPLRAALPRIRAFMRGAYMIS